MPSPRLVIFDCDGVLVDSEPAAARVLRDVLEQEGLPLSVREVDERYRGRSLRDCVLLIEAELRRPLPSDFIERLNERTNVEFEKSLTPIPFVEDVLRALVAAGTKCCVASSGAPEKMRLTLGLTGLLPYFDDALFSAKYVEHGKPAPDLFLHALTEMGAHPDQAVVIEDSLPGVIGARAAGIRVFGYAPDGDGAPLEKAGAEVFRDMRELLTRFELSGNALL